MLARMPDLYRIPMLLVYLDGFRDQGVATMLNAPLGTVLARLHRGRKLFERELLGIREETNGLLVEPSPMITCAEAVKQLWEYLDGTLADGDRAGDRAST